MPVHFSTALRRARSRYAYLLCALALVTAGCSAGSRSASTTWQGRSRSPQLLGAEFTTRPEIADKDLAAGHFLAALMARFEGDYDVAMKETVRAVSLDPREPRLRYELAQLYIRNGQLRQAFDHVQALVALEPGDPEHRLLAARLLLALQSYQDSIAQYAAVLEMEPNNEEALVMLGALYSRVGKPQQAVEVLQRATALSPDSFMANFGLGKALAASGNYAEALRSFRHAARLNPSIAELHLHMGFVYDRLGLRRKAVESFNKAIDFNPALEPARAQIGTLSEDDPELAAKLARYEKLVDFAEDPLATCAKIGLIYFQRGDYLRAIDDFNIVLGAKPGDDEIRYWLALAYDKVGETEAAVRELKQISPKAARYVDARLFLSSVQEEENDLAGATESVRSLLENNPDNADGLRRLIALYRAQKRYDEAISVANRLVASDPGNDMYLYGLAWLYDEAGDKDKSIVLLRKVIEINPQNADALNHLGFTYADRGENLDEAEQLIKRALQMHPNNGAVIDSLAWVYYQRGDYKAAAAELEKAAELGGRDPVIVEHLADAYLKLGRHIEAERVYRDAEARSEDPEQRARLQRKIHALHSKSGGGAGAETAGGGL